MATGSALIERQAWSPEHAVELHLDREWVVQLEPDQRLTITTPAGVQQFYGTASIEVRIAVDINGHVNTWTETRKDQP